MLAEREMKQFPETVTSMLGSLFGQYLLIADALGFSQDFLTKNALRLPRLRA
jgi:hypothetical protein